MRCLYVRIGQHEPSKKALAIAPDDCTICDIDLIVEKPAWLDGIPLLVETSEDEDVVFYRGTKCLERLQLLASQSITSVLNTYTDEEDDDIIDVHIDDCEVIEPRIVIVPPIIRIMTR